MKQVFYLEEETEWKLDPYDTKQALELVRSICSGKNYINWLNQYSLTDMLLRQENRKGERTND